MMLRILLLTILTQDLGDAVFKAGSTQVRVDAQVSNNGRPVDGLTQKDFSRELFGVTRQDEPIAQPYATLSEHLTQHWSYL